jgi:hypothetical protein
MAGEIPRLKTTLQRLLRDLGLEQRFKSEQIAALWPQIVGDAVAKIARPTQFRGGTLFVDVVDHVWMQELKLRERDLLDRLDRALGGPLVGRLFLRLGQMPPAASSAPAEAAPVPRMDAPLPPDEEAALERELASVADPELRQVLQRLRRRMLQGRTPERTFLRQADIPPSS